MEQPYCQPAYMAYEKGGVIADQKFDLYTRACTPPFWRYIALLHVNYMSQWKEDDISAAYKDHMSFQESLDQTQACLYSFGCIFHADAKIWAQSNNFSKKIQFFSALDSNVWRFNLNFSQGGGWCLLEQPIVHCVVICQECQRERRRKFIKHKFTLKLN